MPRRSVADCLMYAYKNASEGATLLCNELDIWKIRHEGSKFRGGVQNTVINWGAGGDNFGANVGAALVLNKPANVMLAIDKRTFFDVAEQAADGPRVPFFTEYSAVAKQWLKEGACVLARTKVQGAGGEGIVIMDKVDDMVQAKLYTKYIEKDLEYRVYLCRDEVIETQRKARNLDEEPKNWKVRSRENGFIYVSAEMRDVPEDVYVQSKKALKVLGLDFGGVDVIVNKRDGRTAFVLEVNTAPWLSEAIAKKLAASIRRIIEAA